MSLGHALGACMFVVLWAWGVALIVSGHWPPSPDVLDSMKYLSLIALILVCACDHDNGK